MNWLFDWVRRGTIRSWRIVAFTLYMTFDFVQSNLQVLVEVLRLRPRATPAVVEVRVASRTELELVSLANLVTLTPGTLTLEAFRDPPTLFVHGMFVHDPEEFRQQILTLEQHMLTALRPVGRRGHPGTAGPVGAGTEVIR
jgi:multicomponent Na+:H+ antiporter subunit E